MILVAIESCNLKYNTNELSVFMRHIYSLETRHGFVHTDLAHNTLRLGKNEQDTA